MSGRPAARAAASSGGDVGRLETDVVQAFAALLEELGDAAVRIDRLEELDLAAADRQERGLHALVLHRRLGGDAQAEAIPPEGEAVLEPPHDQTHVMLHVRAIPRTKLAAGRSSPAAIMSTSRCLRTLPDGVIGSASAKYHSRGHLYPASRPRQ